MANKELQTVIDYMEREKGIDRNVLIETIKSSLQSAARKSVSGIANPIIEINPDTFEVKVNAKFTVVEDMNLPSSTEIQLSNARQTHPEANVGDSISVEVTPENFGRIAAQTAKQVLIQKLRDAESDRVFSEYKDKVYQVITGTVRQREGSNVIIDLGRGEAILKGREQIENEDYNPGDRLKVLVIEVKKSMQSPEILVSRSHPSFVKKLFEIEVPEIADGTVEIKGIAREPGYRTKIAVFSKDPKVDCVGACVGMRGTRVKNIVQELNGEKIDIVPWSADIETFVRNAMNPAKLRHIAIDDEKKRIQIYVDKSQFSLAIGKHGHNARLTSKLVGWKIDIEVVEKETNLPVANVPKKETKPASESIESVATLHIPINEIEGLSHKVKDSLQEAGYKYLADLQNIKVDELYTIPGVGKSSAEEIMEIIRKTIKEKIIGA